MRPALRKSRLGIVFQISSTKVAFAKLAEHPSTPNLDLGLVKKVFLVYTTPCCRKHSWRYRLGVALSIDIPYLRALFIALSLMVQVVASLLFFCLFVFSSFLSFSLLFIGKLFLLDEETLVVLHQSSVAFCSFSSQEKSDCQGGHRYCFGSFNWI